MAVRGTGIVLAFALMLSCAAAQAASETQIVFSPVGSNVAISAALIRPDGEGPFPAIVLMHDCSGLGPRSSGAPRRWAKELVDQGYVAVIPDSFEPRGLPNGVCTLPPDQTRHANGYARAADAYGALAELRALPYVDGKRVGVMGGSHGGWTTLAAMYRPIDASNPLIAAKRDGFAAAIALYPNCANRYGDWAVGRANGTTGAVTGYSGVYQPVGPLLILSGEKDDWTPAEPCRQLAETARVAGYPVEIKIYPGAHHSFDNSSPMRFVAARTNGFSPTGKGATTGGDPAAWADARKRVAEFFARHLKEAR